MKLRIDKYLADMSFGTRTEIKKAVQKGLVTVNGQTIKKADVKVDPETDHVAFAGKPVAYETFSYYLLYKPAGCVSATEDKKHKTVIDYLPEDARRDLFPVGRLDLDTEGLLLLTNDGELAHQLLAPKKHVPKTYFAVIDQAVTVSDADAFAQGVDIGEDTLTKPAKLEILQSQASGSEILLTITEGKFHQVKRMFQAVGKEVTYLKRLSMANLVLDDSMQPGDCRKLTEKEVADVRGYQGGHL